MATIKDVAKLAGVSVATVSIVMNNKSKERSIPVSTQERIKNVMKELGYQPNLSARRLRSSYKQPQVTALFWPIGYRLNVLSSLMNELSREINKTGFDCEIVLQTYEPGNINKYDEALTKRGYNGVIVGACSEDDLAHLEQMNLLMPVVLINRESEKFSSVNIDADLVGVMAAREFARKGLTSAGVFVSQSGSLSANMCVQSFLKQCKAGNIEVDFDNIMRCESTFDGGYYIAGKFCALKKRPKAVFCDCDAAAIGALKAFHDVNLRVPRDVRVLAVDMNVSGVSAYYSPSLSVIEISSEAIARKVINVLQRRIASGTQDIEHLTVRPRLVQRESC